MQVERIVLAVVCLLVTAMTLRRGLILWHRGRRQPKNLVRAFAFHSRAFYSGLERAMLPMAAFGAFMAVALLVSASTSAGTSHLTGVRWWLGVIAAGGFGVSIALTLAIIYFNRPRWIVPPFMRSEQGIATAWWRRR